MKAASVLGIGLAVILTAGCGSSYRIATINGKMSCSFNDTSVSRVCEVIITSFGPLKGYKVEMPAELKERKISLELSDVTTTEPVRKTLEEVTNHKVEIDRAKKVIRFTKR